MANFWTVYVQLYSTRHSKTGIFVLPVKSVSFSSLYRMLAVLDILPISGCVEEPTSMLGAKQCCSLRVWQETPLLIAPAKVASTASLKKSACNSLNISQCAFWQLWMMPNKIMQSRSCIWLDVAFFQSKTVPTYLGFLFNQNRVGQKPNVSHLLYGWCWVPDI